MRRHGRIFYARYRDPRTGKKVEKSLGTDDEATAKRLLNEIKKRERRAMAAKTIGETLKSYGDEWLEQRERVGIRSIKDERRWLVRHIYPELGHVPVHLITPRDLREWGMRRRAGKLAPKSIWNAYGVLRSLMRAACVDGLIAQTPCILTETELGTAKDRDPGWRPRALYSREELHTLCYDERLSPADRIAHALAGLAGLREGEACGLRWGDIERRQPLSALIVCRSYDGPPKSDEARQVPVHPALAAILAGWKLSGWAELVGRAPHDDDFVIVTGRTRRGRAGRGRSKSMAYKAWAKALAVVELETEAKRGEAGGRSYHDLRRTFITLAQNDGADKAVLEHVTHRGRGSRAIDLYTTIPWHRLCDAVASLRFGRDQSLKVTQ